MLIYPRKIIMWGHNENSDILKARRQILTQNLIWDFQPPELKNKFLLFKLLIQWYFVKTVQLINTNILV